MLGGALGIGEVLLVILSLIFVLGGVGLLVFCIVKILRMNKKSQNDKSREELDKMKKQDLH